MEYNNETYFAYSGMLDRKTDLIVWKDIRRNMEWIASLLRKKIHIKMSS